MTKQNEVREGIAKIVYTDWGVGGQWENLMAKEKTPWLETADHILEFEDSRDIGVHYKEHAKGERDARGRFKTRSK